MLGLHQLEVPLGAGVEAQAVAARGDGGHVERGRGVALQRGEVARDEVGRPRGQREIGEVRVRVAPPEGAAGGVGRRDARDAAAGDERGGRGVVGGDQHLRRVEALQLGGGILGAELARAELAGGHVGPGEAHPVGGGGDQGDEIGRAVLAQQGGVGDGAGREGADDAASAHRVPRVGPLLADGDPVAAGEEALEKVVERVVAEAALRDGRAAAAGGPLAQLEAQLARQQLGVIEEDLVEAADPEEEEHARLAVAQGQVLAHQLAVRLSLAHRALPPW